MVEIQLVPQSAAGPIEEHDQGHDLDGPKFDVVNDPMWIKPLPTHTISYPAERDWRFQNCWATSTLAPTGGPYNRY